MVSHQFYHDGLTSRHIMSCGVMLRYVTSHIIPPPPTYICIYNELMNLTHGHLYIVSDNMYIHTSLANNFIGHATVMVSTVAKVFLTAHGICSGVYTLRVVRQDCPRVSLPLCCFLLGTPANHVQLASVPTEYLVHVVHVHPKALCIYDF